jgi:hypothetical protein
MTTYAAFIGESRMKFADPPSLAGNLGEVEGSAVLFFALGTPHSL